MAASNHNLGDKNRSNRAGDATEDLSGDRVGDEVRDSALDQELEDEDEEEVVDEDYVAPLEDDDFISDDDSEEQVLADEALSPKEQDARSLAIRRAIEQRQERQKLDEDLDYLDLDLDT